ncbi:MAG: two-component system response regulator NarL [Gammaproteobacteria bacterium]|nr:two-component system response regulator NarL [Gammaproteobacteria bacterium]
MTHKAPAGADECRILLVDDHPLLRQGVAQLLALEPGFSVVAETANGAEAVQLAVRHHPDLILLDWHMHGLNGLDTLKALRAAEIDARIVIYTVSDSQDDVVAAFRAGADGYLLKDMEPAAFLDKLREAVCYGHTVVSEQLSAVLATALRKPHKPAPDSLDTLSEREGQILRLVATGQSNKLIARELEITEGTVKVHVKNLLKKLHLRSRVEAAVFAVQNGLGRGL